MKVAILVDVYTEYVNLFNQRVEDIVNDLGGRLIYRIQSSDPIRLVRAENPITHPSYTPSPSQGLGVKNARSNKRNERGSMDGADHRNRGSFDYLGRVDADVRRCLDRLRQRDNGPHRSRSSGACTDSPVGCGAASTRLFPAFEGATVDAITTVQRFPEAFREKALCGGSPSLAG